MNHASTVPVAHHVRLLDDLVRSVFVRAGKKGPTLSERESQVFRDGARSGERRPLGTVSIARGLMTLGEKSAAYAIAAAVMTWADAVFGTPRASDLERAWASEEREEMEADVAVVGAIGTTDVAVVDHAIAEKLDEIAANYETLAVLRAKRDSIVRPMSHGWRA